MHPTCGVNLFTGASTEANLCREGPFLCRGAANARAVNFHNVKLQKKVHPRKILGLAGARGRKILEIIFVITCITGC